MAGRARHGVVPRQDRIEEQHLAEFHLLRCHRVVGRNRRVAQGRQLRRPVAGGMCGARQPCGRKQRGQEFGNRVAFVGGVDTQELLVNGSPAQVRERVLEIKELDPRRQFKALNLNTQEKYKSGEIIDGYTLIKPLIQNERTWLCEKRGFKYVIKFVPFEAMDDELMLDIYVKEVWMAKRLKAGFFPKAVVPKNRTHRYYIMAYVEGKNLKEFIAKKPLSVDLSVELASFLLKMSQYLMRLDLVHGDIKPENIIVTQRKGKTVFKMVDFGSITEAYSTVTRAGTPSYLAPERFKQAPVNEQTELYAIGVTLYEVLTQKYPYGEIEPFQTPSFEKMVKVPSKVNAKIPLWLESIILRALDTDTKTRYHNYSEMQYEVTNPEKVKPYFSKGVSYMEREPLFTCRVMLGVMIVLNILQFLL